MISGKGGEAVIIVMRDGDWEENKMYIDRKAYKKARWRKKARRTLKQNLEAFPWISEMCLVIK